MFSKQFLIHCREHENCIVFNNAIIYFTMSVYYVSTFLAIIHAWSKIFRIICDIFEKCPKSAVSISINRSQITIQCQNYDVRCTIHGIRDRITTYLPIHILRRSMISLRKFSENLRLHCQECEYWAFWFNALFSAFVIEFVK